MLRPYSRSGLLALAVLCMPVVITAQFDGYALFNAINQTTARLINSDAQIEYTWSCPSPASYAMALKENGNIVRGAIHSPNFINGAAVSGKVQELDPQGQVVWEFIYSTQDHVTHHDLCLMPNGNVLLIAWVRKTLPQLQALGYTGSSAKYPGRIIEVQQNGNGGEIVWQWEMADRFIQYVDPNKPNYMPIAEHPERLNINVPVNTQGGGPGSTDWFHENGIDYNPELDQIAFSSRYLREIFIIDHSTTTEEAAGHTGGNAGRGGDFLYRFGRPGNYGATGTNTITAAVHDVKWVKPGRPYEGWVMYVNNSGGPGNSTVIDMIDPVRDGYTYPKEPGQPWGPATYQWRHQCVANASGQSAAEMMPNGNLFVCLSGAFMYEVDSNNNLVWQYNSGPAKAFRYTCDDPGIIALLGEDPCGLSTAVGAEKAPAPMGVFPNPTTGPLELYGSDRHSLRSVVVRDAQGRELLRNAPDARLDLGALPDGLYHVVLEQRDGGPLHHKVLLQR